MSIKLGATPITRIMLGSTPIKRVMLGSTLVWSAVPANGLLNGLWEHWTLDETTGSRIGSHASKVLSAYGSPGYSAGVIGNAVATSLGNSLGIGTLTGLSTGGTNAITFNAWIKASLAGWALGCNNSEFLLRSEAGKWQFVLNSFTTNDRVSSTTGPSFSAFQMVTCVYRSGGALEIWVNGSLETSLTPTGTWAAITEIEVGAGSSRSQYFEGWIDEFAVWGTGLSQTQIEALYNSGASLDFSQYTS